MYELIGLIYGASSEPWLRGSKRPLKVCKSDVPEENLTLSLLLRSRTVVESQVRGLSFHLLYVYQRPFFVIVEANAGSRKLAKVTNTPKTTPGRPVCLSIEPQHYAFKLEEEVGGIWYFQNLNMSFHAALFCFYT